MSTGFQQVGSGTEQSSEGRRSAARRSDEKSTEALLADLVVGTSDSDISPGARIATVRHAVDCVGVILAACAEPAGRVLVAHAREAAVSGGVQIIGDGTAVPPAMAAWCNASLAHLLDFDDHGFSHPTAILLPVALAVGAATGASGREAVSALVLGYEVFERLARSARPHEPATRGSGIHPTSVYGAPAAAAVAARLLDLDHAQVVTALGIAATQGFGLSQQFGTWAKGVNAGNAAQAGVTAAQLAKRGFEGDSTGISGRYGLFQAIHGEGNFDLSLVHEEAGRWAIEDPGLALKPYPACTSNLKSVDAMVQIFEEVDGYDPAKVARIKVDVHPDIFHTLRHRRPTKGFNGKFSLDYTVAAAALDGTLTLDSFSDASAQRREFRAMLEKVELVEHPDWPMRQRRYQPVTVEFSDGTSASREVAHHRGTKEWPLTQEECATKFRTCASRFLSPEQAGSAFGEFSNLDGDVAVSELTRHTILS